jgi:hypothetical protein
MYIQMDYNSKIHVILFILVIILFGMYFNLTHSRSENFTAISNESLQNLASVYNMGTLTVDNIVTTGNITSAGDITAKSLTTVGGIDIGDSGTINKNFQVKGISNLTHVNATGMGITGGLAVTGPSTLGKYNIRDDRIGIPGRGDIQIGEDSWTRLYTYNGNDYAGVAGSSGGFAGLNLWSQQGTAMLADTTTSNLTATNANINNRIYYKSAGKPAF